MLLMEVRFVDGGRDLLGVASVASDEHLVGHSLDVTGRDGGSYRVLVESLLPGVDGYDLIAVGRTSGAAATLRRPSAGPPPFPRTSTSAAQTATAASGE